MVMVNFIAWCGTARFFLGKYLMYKTIIKSTILKLTMISDSRSFFLEIQTNNDSADKKEHNSRDFRLQNDVINSSGSNVAREDLKSMMNGADAAHIERKCLKEGDEPLNSNSDFTAPLRCATPEYITTKYMFKT